MRIGRRVLLVLTLVCTLLLVCSGSAAAGAAEADLRFTCRLENDTVKLGEDVVLRVRLLNRSARDLVVPALRLADDSLSFKVEGAGSPALVTRLYGGFAVGKDGPVFQRKRTARRELAPGARLETTIRFAAVRTGELIVTPVFGPAGKQRRSAARLTLRVLPRAPGNKPLVLAFETARGPFKARLDGARAFNSASHFWTLAREGFYDQLPVHRVVPDVLVQSGDPRGDGLGGPGWYLPAEAHTADLARGALALARGSHVDSAGSQWFVALGGAGSAEAFGDGFAVVGEVIEGLELLDAMASVAVVENTATPIDPERIESVKAGR